MAPRRFSYGSLVSDLGYDLKAWEEQYVSKVSYLKFARACCAYVTDESAKAVSKDIQQATAHAFHDPTPWKLRAWQYRRSLGKGRQAGLVEAETYVLDEQSVVLKYAMGEDTRNVRYPGEVGLAQDRVLLPHWRNLMLIQRVKLTASHDLLGATMARLVRNASGVYAKRSVPGRWGVYRGEVKVGRSRLIGYIARPSRARIPASDADTQRSILVNGKVRNPTRVVNLGRSRILFISVPKATYRLVLQPWFEKAVSDARKNVADLMASELAKSIVHRGYKENRARIGVQMQQADQAINPGQNNCAGALMAEARGIPSRLR